MKTPAAIPTPDDHAFGFLDRSPDPMRYEYAAPGPDDVSFKIGQRIKKGATVLDVGCGSGAVSVGVKALSGCRIIGIEPDAERAILAEQRGIEVIRGFLTDDLCGSLPAVDHVVFADVIEHLPNPGRIIICAASLLKPGGTLIASVPNIAHWSVRYALLNGQFEYQDCGIMDATHLRWFTHKSLVSFFERLGFDVISLDQTLMDGFYSSRKILRRLSRENRARLLRYFLKWAPGLFGAQIVIEARRRAEVLG